MRARLCTARSCLPAPTRCARLAEPSGRKARCQTNHRAGNTKPRGLWGAADTVSRVVLEPQVWRQKAGPGPRYLHEGPGRGARYHRHHRPGQGKGRVDSAWVVSCCDFVSFCGRCFLFYLFRFVVVNSLALGKTWRRYPPVQTAAVNFYSLCSRSRRGSACPRRVIYSPRLSGLAFFTCVFPPRRFHFPPALQMPGNTQASGEQGGVLAFHVCEVLRRRMSFSSPLSF